MKKAEMVVIVGNLIKKHKFCCGPYDLAALILMEVEKYGMLPPKTEVFGGDGKVSTYENTWTPDEGLYMPVHQQKLPGGTSET